MSANVKNAPSDEKNNTKTKYLSLVIPAYNEEESISTLVKSIKAVVEPMKITYEVLFIDDGSSDNTAHEIQKLINSDTDNVKCIWMRHNFGKSLALAVGFAECVGEIVITMDADLQDDPAEIPKLIEKINQGWDLVSGWKANRLDPNEKKLASKVFNAVVSYVSGIKLKDFNCGLKAYRKEVVKKIHVYGGRHRFIPVIAKSYGFRICEIEVRHHKRKFGVSKYGYRRYLSGLLDFFTIMFLMFYQRRPLHFLGKISFIPFMLGISLVTYALTMKFFYGQTGNRPSLLVGFFLLGTAFQVFFFGLLAELIAHVKISQSFNPQDYTASKPSSVVIKQASNNKPHKDV